MEPSKGSDRAQRFSAADLDGMVDASSGTISRRIFVDEEIFEQELEQLFARAWLFIGHESQVPNPGDFFLSRMGTESVILTRDDAGELHVLLNSCRHRGMKVCRYDEGNTLQFTCPYHGWSYSVDGSLVDTPGELFGVPHFKAGYEGRLDRSQWGLVRVAQMVNRLGFVFATWDPEAPPFEDYVGEFHYWLDNLAASTRGASGAVRAFRGVQRWRIRSNWKFVAENFLGDNYHGPPSHASADSVGIGPGGKSAATRHGAAAGRPRSVSSTSFVHLGHGATSSADYAWGYPEFEEPELTAYFQAAWAERNSRYETQGRPVGALGPATLFPNLSFHAGGFPRSLLVAHPQSPWETEVWRWYLVDDDAPEDVAEWLRHYYLRYSGPAGLVEQDDMENWGYATEASRGTIARRYPYNYQLGLGTTRPSRLAGAVESEFFMTEENARNYYRRWAAFVAGESWPDLMDAEREL